MISSSRNALFLTVLAIAACNPVEAPQGDFCESMNEMMSGKLQFAQATLDQMSEINEKDVATIKVRWSQCPGMENRDVDEAFSRLKDRLESQR